MFSSKLNKGARIMKMFNYSNFIKKVVEKAYLEMTKKYGMTNNEIAVISYLSVNTNATASDIVNDLLFSKSHVSLSVDALTKKGMIEKKQDKQDKKIYHLQLTSKSQVIIDELFVRRNEIEKVFFKGFSENDKFLLQTLIQKVVLNIKDSTLLK